MQRCAKELTEKKLDLSKIVTVSTEGACSVTGKKNGFINLFTQHVGHSILSFHCIIVYTSKCYVQKLLLNHCRILWME